MATFDPATMVFGGFADQLDAAFGASMGWFIGNLLVLIIAFGLIQALTWTCCRKDRVLDARATKMVV